MVTIVTDYLDNSARIYPNKIAFADEHKSITFKELQNAAKKIAMVITDSSIYKKPVAIYLDKGCDCISSFLGVVYSGNFYSPLDTKMPIPRIEKIIATLQPALIITDVSHKDAAKQFAPNSQIITLEMSYEVAVDENKLENITSKVLDTDLLYVLFTSGSTGTPKGVAVSERALIDFTEWVTSTFDVNESFVFANQTPFYFVMSVFDIYQTLKNAATCYIVPLMDFSFPPLLMQYLAQHKVNTIYWVPSALSFVSACGALTSPYLTDIKNIFFSGEVMPMKHLNKWMDAYPNVRFVNFYGPTEVTDTCAYYEVNRRFENTEKLPIGKPCKNMDVFLLDDNQQLVVDDRVGEVCVRGCGLAYGYYNAPDKTAEAFVQNPLNNAYPERIYRTGDLAQRNEYGELVYVSRKDFQIKHMGHRIELGEIEVAATSIEGVEACCCLFDNKKSRIILLYTGVISESDLMDELRKLVPIYMLPNKKLHLDNMPLNINGKIDRQKLKEMVGV